MSEPEPIEPIEPSEPSEPSEPIEPAERSAKSDDSSSLARPDWLVGADEGVSAETEALRLADTGSIRPLVPRPVAPLPRAPRPEPRESRPEPRLTLVPPPAPPAERVAEPPPPPEEPVAEAQPAGPVAWKAAASSVPRLLVKPAPSALPAEPESFPGFAQDGMAAKNPVAIGGSGPQSAADLLAAVAPEDTGPLAKDPPFWMDWLDRLRMVPRPALFALGAVIVIGVATYMLFPRETPGVSLAQIIQHPEAFEGRIVRVGGKAGETFSVGGSYVFSLSQGRDTIVVYSRSRRPAMHERVKVSGTVSIGYLDGVPRVALLEDASAH
jgi:hypothetical protein